MPYYVGLDIGGTKCSACLGKVDGDFMPVVLKKEMFLTANLTPAEVLERFSRFIEDVKKEHEVQAIGISCGGPLDSRRGIIQAPPSLPLWDNIEIVRFFNERFKVPVHLQNDANACAVAEWKYGAGKGSSDMIFLTFGTGFGGGLIMGGRLQVGANDNAGEIGHVRLTKSGPLGYYKNGSCEGYCSGSGIKRLADILAKKSVYRSSYSEFISSVGEQNVSAKTIAEYAKKGNRFCLAVYKKSGKMLGKTLSILVDVLNPEKIVLGGVFMRSGDLLLPHAKREMKKECLPAALSAVRICPAALGESVGDIAALSVAIGDF